jgi:deazaflavin-dependent oxidoreductase (nitroreductase family)
LLQIRWFVRAPIWLFRARLGFLAGSRLLLLEHLGRSSGLRRQVVLEVVDRPGRGSYVVASGFGERAQWFRNIRANPAVRVTVGAGRPRAAVAHVLAPADARAALEAYAREHPRAWRQLRTVFEATLGTEIGEDGTGLPLVRLDIHRPAGRS